MRIRIELDDEVKNRLIESAVRNRRPIAWQAEMLLRQALADESCPESGCVVPEPEEVPACKANQQKHLGGLRGEQT